VPGDGSGALLEPVARCHYGDAEGGDGLQANDFTLLDQNGVPWTLSEHLDTARIVVFLRGDW